MAPYQLAVLEEQDAEWAEYFMAPLTGEESEEDVMKKFYKMTSQPLQVIMMIYRVNIQVVSNLPYEAHVLKRNFVLESTGGLSQPVEKLLLINI